MLSTSSQRSSEFSSLCNRVWSPRTAMRRFTSARAFHSTRSLILRLILCARVHSQGMGRSVEAPVRCGSAHCSCMASSDWQRQRKQGRHFVSNRVARATVRRLDGGVVVFARRLAPLQRRWPREAGHIGGSLARSCFCVSYTPSLSGTSGVVGCVVAILSTATSSAAGCGHHTVPRVCGRI